MSSTKRKTLLTVKTDTDTFVLHDFLAALSEFGHIDPYLDFPRERNVFNAPKKPREKSYVYDAVFSKESGFNPKQRRDDRRHDKMIGLSVCREVSQFMALNLDLLVHLDAFIYCSNYLPKFLALH
uniref:LAGLIDADG_2 domain-containing protein n=1 Tax=Mesocestoides corti TaxID=53468 RepID=A0A5K3EWD7_MESCO